MTSQWPDDWHVKWASGNYFFGQVRHVSQVLIGGLSVLTPNKI